MLSQVLLNSPRSLPIAIVVALVAIIAVAWLYPPQVKGLSFGWRWGLPMLRAGGMLALAAALLKPAVLRPKTAEEQGSVVILVDRSRSMAVADSARTPAQLVALAAGLGRLPQGVRSDRAEGVAARAVELRPLLAAADRAAGDLEYARVAGRGVETARQRVTTAGQRLREGTAALARVGEALNDPTVKERLAGLDALPLAEAGEIAAALAAVRAKLEAVGAAAAAVQAAGDEQLYKSNAQVRAACDELARMSRFELTGQALLGRGTGLLSKLRGDMSVVAFGFAGELSPLPLGGDGAPAVSATAPATRPAPSTAPTLAAAPDGRRSDIAGAVRRALDLFGSRDVAAVVLFSDGRQTGSAGAVTSGLAAAGTPVYAVSVAPPGALRDVSVASVTAPVSAFVGETATVRAEVRPQGSKDVDGQLKLVAQGIGGEQVRAVKTAEGRPGLAEFQVKLERPGAQLLTVSLAPVAGEATAENNAARRWVKVLSQKVKVGAFAALPGWDFQYLRNALSRTPWVGLEAAVLSPAAPRVPMTADQILAQDVLVLSDVPVAALDETQWSAVYRLVSERGGSVILLAGAAHLPGEYGQHLVASSLLPYPAELTPTWRMWPGEVPMFRLVPHPNAVNDPVLRIGDEGDVSSTHPWQTLPGFYRILPIGRLKPGAQALLVEASSGEPVLTQVRIGAGKAFLLGANETWRWRSGPSKDVHDRFWLQLVRYAAGEPFAARSDRLALDVDKVAFDAGEVVQAKARAFTGLAPVALRLEVLRDAHTIQTPPLTPTGVSNSGHFTARAGPYPEGDYQLRLSEAGGAGATGVSLSFQVTADYEAELADVSADPSVLTRLAESSAGELYRLEEMDRLAERVNLTAERRSGYFEQRLWESPYLFVLVVACFAAEWAARKRLGLA